MNDFHFLHPLWLLAIIPVLGSTYIKVRNAT